MFLGDWDLKVTEGSKDPLWFYLNKIKYGCLKALWVPSHHIYKVFWDLISSKFIIAVKKIFKKAGEFLAKAGEMLAAAGEEFSPGFPGPLYKP